MTRKEAMRQTQQADTLISLGFTRDEAETLRRISMTLHRWYELECGDSNEYASWAIERDENDKPFMVRHAHMGACKTWRTPIADREKGAIKRLVAILKRRNVEVSRTGFPVKHLDLTHYLQTDPRGASLYIIRPGDVPDGADVSAYYNRGICVY